MRRLFQRILTVAILLASGSLNYAIAHTSDASNLAEAREHYEKQKEQITHASDYIDSHENTSRQELLDVEQNHADAMDIKVEKNEK